MLEGGKTVELKQGFEESAAAGRMMLNADIPSQTSGRKDFAH